MPESGLSRGRLQGQSLLCVVAHPDDESLACGGVLGWCAELGARVGVLCLTRGEHGPRGTRVSPPAPPEALGAVRLEELQAACRVLGVASVTVLEHGDGMLPWVDPVRLEGDIARVIEHLHPDVVITFDEDGLYWHPDHVAVHERTTSVVQRLGARAPALYYVTLPPDAMQAVAGHARTRHAALSGASPAAGLGAPIGVLGVPAGAFGSGAPEPTLLVDASLHAARKLEALCCHATQMAGSALSLVTRQDAGLLLGREQYRRARAGRQGPTFLDSLGQAREPRELREP